MTNDNFETCLLILLRVKLPEIETKVRIWQYNRFDRTDRTVVERSRMLTFKTSIFDLAGGEVYAIRPNIR